jgi:hypothetical protein
VWAEEPKRKKKPPMGFGVVSRRAEGAGSDDSQQPSA